MDKFEILSRKVETDNQYHYTEYYKVRVYDPRLTEDDVLEWAKTNINREAITDKEYHAMPAWQQHEAAVYFKPYMTASYRDGIWHITVSLNLAD